jgi:hypothetical protein
MKKLREVLGVLISCSLMLFLCSCCCLRCHKPESACKNLIRDGNFELPDNVSRYGYVGVNDANGQNFGYVQNNTADLVWHGDAVSPDYLGLFPNTYAAHPTDPDQLFHATPNGINFVCFTFNKTSNHGPFNASTLKQDIATPLTVGTYKFSFLQAALSSLYPDVGGLVNVQLMPTTGGTSIFNEDFSVTNTSDWKSRSALIHVRQSDLASNASGLYTIKFSSYSGTNVAVIDAVSLCQKH